MQVQRSKFAVQPRTGISTYALIKAPVRHISEAVRSHPFNISMAREEFVDFKTAEAAHQMAATHNATGSTMQFSFGVISDIQHADIEDGTSFHGVPRFYRNSKVALRRAVNAWRTNGSLTFAVHFGDILDGYQPKDKSAQVLDGLLEDLDQLGKPVYHMLGNHCLYNLPRAHLNQKLGIHQRQCGSSYYCVKPAPGWRILVVDSYDVSILGWPEDHPLHQQAKKLLYENNPNENKNSPEGLEGTARRWVQFGGGASQQQLQWVKEQLQEAASNHERVMVFSHLPLMPGSCPNPCLLWNYEEMLEVLRESGVVALTIAGHTHQNGYKLDEAGIHHVVLPAVLETPPGRDCYGHIEVFNDRIELRGVDAMMSLTLPLAPEQSKLPSMLEQLSSAVV